MKAFNSKASRKNKKLARSRRSRSNASGFTLVELLVSLVAGLIVAVAVFSISKAATQTFHEEARSASAQSSVRNAIDRLRGDIQRAGFMTTGNITFDPQLARVSGSTPGTAMTSGPVEYKRLSAIRFYSGSTGGSKTGTDNTSTYAEEVTDTLSTVNSLQPDAIDLTGNFGSTDQYVVELIGDVGTGSCNGRRITLAVDAPSMWRIYGMPNKDAALQAAFSPVRTANGFLVRLVDDKGFVQFAATCPTDTGLGNAAGWAAAAGSKPYLDIQAVPGILTSGDTGGRGGIAGLAAGTILVNPVQTVRWSIGKSPAAYDDLRGTKDSSGTGSSAVNLKYDLLRRYIDAAGTPAGTAELIAEYVVDLKFGFTVDAADYSVNSAQVDPILFTFALDDAVHNAEWGRSIADVSPGRPQRIRSVRSRVVTRTQLPDRKDALAVDPLPAAPASTFLYRYCIEPAGCSSGQLGWARTRTIVVESALLNQMGAFYP